MTPPHCAQARKEGIAVLPSALLQEQVYRLAGHAQPLADLLEGLTAGAECGCLFAAAGIERVVAGAHAASSGECP
ncbi:MAG TPA: hypothetical protein VG013_33815 [Gemmataceae bacterium]|nr:hypothetical protein [Gemmataceae bacterium]